MGVSTDAILAYGIDLGADEDISDGPLAPLFSEDEGFTLDSLIAEAAGLGPEPDYETERDAWHAWLDAMRKAEKAYPLEAVQHCSGEYPMRLIALRSSVMDAKRGAPVAVPDLLPGPSEDQLAAMRAFCERFGLVDKTPGWFLFSYWG